MNLFYFLMRKKKVIVSKQGNYRMKITILKGGKR